MVADFACLQAPSAASSPAKGGSHLKQHQPARKVIDESNHDDDKAQWMATQEEKRKGDALCLYRCLEQQKQKRWTTQWLARRASKRRPASPTATSERHAGWATGRASSSAPSRSRVDAALSSLSELSPNVTLHNAHSTHVLLQTNDVLTQTSNAHTQTNIATDKTKKADAESQQAVRKNTAG